MNSDHVCMHFDLRLVLLVIVISLTLAGQPASADAPSVKITQPPVFGQWWSYMYGTVSGVVPDDYWIAPLLCVPGLSWYSKPYDRDYPPYARIVDISSNGSWVTQMQTGGIDNLATIVVAYLIPKSSYPACYPFVSGAHIPASLEAAAVASDRALTTGQRTISWSGQEWFVKTSTYASYIGRVGPGNNYFSDSSDNVWVDDASRLHMKIVNDGSRWTCSEIASATRLGYGTYRFFVDSQLNNIDKYATLGLFTWSDLSSPNGGNREIDLEFTTWGLTILPNNAQYAIQPTTGTDSNIFRYQMTSVTPSIHSFLWEPDKVSFTSTDGSGSPINSWVYSNASGVPASADERVHLNLWLNKIAGPSNGQPVEVVVSKFEFTPWQDPAHPTFGINGRSASDSLSGTVSDKYKFKLWGKVTAKDCDGLLLNDGSPIPLRVLDPGHTFNLGDNLLVEGSLSGSSTKQLDTSTGRIDVIK